MADAQSLKKKRKFRNYMCSFVATYKVGVALEQFTVNGLQVVHDHIKQKLGNLPVCLNQCSQNNRDIQRWCVTCTDWRNELETFIAPRFNRMQWHDKKSWCWPNGPRDIAEVFILQGWPTGNINLQDISTIFNVWNRCLHFNRNAVQKLALLKDNRNDLIHDSHNMRLTNARKKLVFQNIKNVINHPDVLPLIPNHANLSQLVRDLEKGKLFKDDIVSSLRDIGMQNANIKATLDGLVLECRNINKTTLNMFGRIQRDLHRLSFRITALSIIVLALVISYFMKYAPACTMQSDTNYQQPWHHSNQNEELQRLTSKEGCFPEATGNDDLGRISLFEYISHHENFTGRDWLIEIIDKKLREDQNRGVLLEADMGYGKSALMKHIICAPKHSLAHRLRRRLIAFHVCRFDVIVSKRAHIFVWRLVDMISAQIPLLSDEINSCKKIYDIRMCEEDTNGCLDQCVMIPLKRYSQVRSHSFIIAIDALDECYDKYRDQNQILNLLKQRLYRFPLGIKFLISTRPNQPRLKQLVKDMFLLKLEDESKDNINDIKNYLKQLKAIHAAPIYSELANSNVTNFQLVILLLENRTEAGLTVSESLDRYYDQEFNRLFSNGKNAFAETKLILEVMCTTFQSPTKDNLWTVVSNSTNISFKQFETDLQMLENFIRKLDGEFYLVHESLYNWLRSMENEDFFVDINNGHKINAMYLFQLIDDGHFPVNIVDLAIHVEYSTESFLRKRFTDLRECQLKSLAKHSDEYPVLELAKRVDSFVATEMLVSHFKEMERRSKNNLTALFIAASLGHLKTFEALVKWNSNVTFRTDSYSDIINFENASRVSFEHMFWGYGVLDIAAQNGHSSIVDYILRNNFRLFDYPMSTLNSMMLLPIHLACKKGHRKIVEQLHTQYNWMLDWQCLYYASETGNINLVKYILRHNIKDQCRLCTTDIHWIPKGHLRVQGRMLYSEKHNCSYVLFDDWNNITCESALHVAVRESKLDIVKLLVEKRQNTIKCVDRGGRTPFISAVQYGFREIVEYFVKFKYVLGNETCSTNIQLVDTSKLHENEIKRLEEYWCENNTSLSHIVAKYDLKWIVGMMHSYGRRLDWNVTDSNGCFPLHIASCHGSLSILEIIFETFNENFKTFKCLNGSNLLHSAAACRSVTATEFLLRRYVRYEYETKLVKMSYIKHAILQENNASLARDVTELEGKTATIISMLVTEESDLLINDTRNRNILHYTIQMGHFNVLNYLFSHYEKTATFLLNAVDKVNRTPLYYAIYHFEPPSQYIIPDNLWKDVFAAPTERMSAKEYSLLITFDFLMKIGSTKIDQHLLEQLVKRGCLNIIVFLIEHAGKFSLEKSFILSAVLENDRHGIQLFAYLKTDVKRFQTIPASEYLNMIKYTNCHELRWKYHLHLLALKYVKVSNLLSLVRLDRYHDALFNYFFPQKWAYLMSTCYDGGDFNVLERAVQGGSSHLVRYLLQAGVTTDRTKVTLVKMSLNGLKYRSENEYFAFITTTKAKFLQVSFIKQDNIQHLFGSNNLYTAKIFLLGNLKDYFKDILGSVTFDKNNLDLLVSELLTHYHLDISMSNMCSSATRQFSVVHRLAFDGLLNGLKLAVKYWGEGILQCRNADGFTPIYMSTIFRYESVTNYIMGHGIKLEVPNEKAETYLYFKLRYKYFFSNDKNRHIKCIMKYGQTIPTTTYRAIKAFNCARKVARAINDKDLLEKIRKLKWDLTFFIEMSTWNKIIMKILPSNLKMEDSSQEAFWKFDAVFSIVWFRDQLKSSPQSNSVISDKFISYSQIVDTEGRICNYLRISYKKMLLKSLTIYETCRIDCRSKDIILNEIKRILVNIDHAEWGTLNCVFINNCFQERASRDLTVNTFLLFRILRLAVINIAMKDYFFLQFLGERLKFHKIQQNSRLWFSLYRYYDYMNDLQTATSYRGSLLYKLKNEQGLSFFRDVGSTIQFRRWSDNAAEIFEKYLKEKSKQ